MYYRKLVKESVTLIFENSPRELKEKRKPRFNQRYG